MLLLDNPIFNDIVLIVAAFAYVIILLSLTMVLKKKELITGFTSRKIIHIFAGFAILVIPYMAMPYLALILPVFLWVLVFFSTPKARTELRNVFETMAQKNDDKTGRLWGPLAYIGVIGIVVAIFTLADPILGFLSSTPSRFFQGRFYYAITALFTMMVGDGLCSVVGRKFGKHKYSLRWTGTTRSLEGSLALLIMSLCIAFAIYLIFGTSMGIPAESTITTGALLTLDGVIILTVVAAVTATIVEAISFTDLDDFNIPISIVLVTTLVSMLFGFWV